jgi:hypothetical protein
MPPDFLSPAYALSLFIGLFNLAQNVTSSKSTYTPDDAPLSLSGLALVAILVLTWRILLRSYQRRAGNEVCAETSACVHATFHR